MSATPPSLLERIWLSWVCFFRVLFDVRFASEVAALRSRDGLEAEAAPVLTGAATAANVVASEVPAHASAATGALQLLALLQREGRFVDFVQQEISSFPDADVGAAARVVHEGCRRALQAHARVVSVRGEAEGAELTLERAGDEVKLVGNVAGSAPFHGVLRHRGWRIEELKLPTRVGVHDPQIVAPAEVELR